MWPRSIGDLEGAFGIGGKQWEFLGGRYAKRTEATETVYFNSRNFKPLFLSFADGQGTEHRIGVGVPNAPAEISVLVPVPSEVFTRHINQYKGIEWNGEAPKRTSVDPRSTVAVCTFSYSPKSMLSVHGVHIRVTTYEPEAVHGAGRRGMRREDLDEMEERFFKDAAVRVGACMPLGPKRPELMRH